MRKSAILFALAAFCWSFSFAQDTPTGLESTTKKTFKPSRDFVMVQLTYEGWNNTPDSIKTGGIGRGMNFYVCYDFPISKSHFSFAAGLGVANSNIFFKDQTVIMNTATDAISFSTLDSVTALNYKRSKLAVTYLETPFELRFYGNKDNRNRGMKIALGMRVGLLMNAHTKDRVSRGNQYINEKTVTKRYVESWRFAPSFRIGWGNISLTGSYNLSPLFKQGQGPEVYPFSIGLCISGL